jgi:hypothetical protein
MMRLTRHKLTRHKLTRHKLTRHKQHGGAMCKETRTERNAKMSVPTERRQR